MALIKCSECGKQISDKAKTCPHCGNENDFVFCSECGNKLSRNTGTCPNCGKFNEENNSLQFDKIPYDKLNGKQKRVIRNIMRENGVFYDGLTIVLYALGVINLIGCFVFPFCIILCLIFAITQECCLKNKERRYYNNSLNAKDYKNIILLKE